MKTFKQFITEGKKTVFKTDTFDLGIKWYEDDPKGARSMKLTVGVGLLGSEELKKIAPRFGNGMYDIIRLSNGNAGIRFTNKGKKYVNTYVYGGGYTEARGESYFTDLQNKFKELVKKEIDKG